MNMNSKFDISKSHTGYWIVKSPYYVYKIATSIKKAKFLRVEHNSYSLAKKKDTPLSNCIPQTTFNKLYLKSKRYKEFLLNKKNLVDDYFLLMKEVSWDKNKISSIINFEILKFLIKEDEILMLEKYFSSFYIDITPAHRDFRTANILLDDNKLVFIDCPFFSNCSTFYFDIMNLLIFGEKEKEEQKNWPIIRNILVNRKISSSNVFKNYLDFVSFEKHLWIAFAIDKVYLELRESMYLHNTILPNKIQKNKEILSWLIHFININN